MDLFGRSHHLEIILLKLAAEHFPLPRSLQSLVLALYAPETEVNAEQAMELKDVLAYLKSIDRYELSPMQAILSQTQAKSDPALPSNEHTAIMEWLDAAYTSWEEQYPVEEPLASEFRKLLPLAAALAITDSNFLTPGSHSFHLLLDTMQASVIGWQSRLGRAGQSLERELVKAIAKARQWFEEDSVDISIVCEEVVAGIKKDRGRAQRMAQRTVETAQGRVKTELARTQSAQMINSLLEKYLAPPPIGEFLKGPWHDSGQLVLLRFGVESPEWATMSTTTEALLDSVQASDTAVDKEGKPDGSRRQQVFEAITKLPRELKRWLLSLAHDEHGLEEAIGMVEFAHMSVLRQQDMDLQTIEPIALDSASSGDNDREVQEHIGQLSLGQWFLFSPEEHDPLRVQLALKSDAGQQLLFTNQAGIKAMQQGYAEFSTALKERVAAPLYGDVSFSCSLAHAAKISSQSDLESLRNAAPPEAKQEHIAAIREQRAQERDAQTQAQQEREEEEQLRREFDEAVLAQREKRDLDENAAREEREKAEALQANEIEAARLKREQAHVTLVPQTAKLTMGAWLGFHDGDTPLLAKLAAHDEKEDNYIFVNRKGVKMRALSERELVSLMDNGLVEILEARSSFKDEDTRARHKHKD